MSSAHSRGFLLLEQRRYDLAAAEFRRALGQDPDAPALHAGLAICLVHTREFKAALREVDEAIRLDPTSAHSHHTRAIVLVQLDERREALAAAQQAIALDPHDADYRGLLANILLVQGRWADALAAADEGLELDASHILCLNIRAQALVHLGRRSEASQSLGESLSEDPNDPFTHANQGWAFLHQGNAKQAETHFREALRLQPDQEWARLGLIEAIKAHNPVYRAILGGFLWMQRQSRWTQIALVLMVIFGPRLLGSLATQYPALGPLIIPISIVFMGILITTWVATPLGNFALLFHPLGRLALKRQEFWQAVIVGGLFLLALLSVVGYLVTGSVVWEVRAAYLGLMIFPLQAVLSDESRFANPAWLLLPICLGLLGLPAFLATFFPGLEALLAPQQIVTFFRYFVQGSVLSTWLPLMFQARSFAR